MKKTLTDEKNLDKLCLGWHFDNFHIYSDRGLHNLICLCLWSRMSHGYIRRNIWHIIIFSLWHSHETNNRLFFPGERKRKKRISLCSSKLLLLLQLATVSAYHHHSHNLLLLNSVPKNIQSVPPAISRKWKSSPRHQDIQPADLWEGRDNKTVYLIDYLSHFPPYM